MSLKWIGRIPWISPEESGRQCDCAPCDYSGIFRFHFLDGSSLAVCQRHVLARGLFSSQQEQERYDSYVQDHPEASYRV